MTLVAPPIKKAASVSRVVTTHLVLPEDTNALGTIFGGTLMAWMDIAAAICAMRHCHHPCVTIFVDDLLFKAPVKLGHIVNITAHMTFVHISSMEIQVTVESEDPITGAQSLVCSAFFTFVSKNPLTGSKIKAPELEISTLKEKKAFDAGAARRLARLKRSDTRE